jgi:hypothetical protein
VSEAAVAMATAAEVAAVAGRGKGTTTPSKGWRTRQEEIVPTGTVARRSSGTSRIPCGGVANNRDEGAVCPTGMRAGAQLLTKKKRKVLDIANKRRNTAACFEVGYVSSSFLHGAEHWYSAPPR